MASEKPDWCINCAAYTAVDKAESEKEICYKVNAEAVGILAGLCKEYGTKLIHISTDYVFGNGKASPYSENDEAAPMNIYGASKLAGERNLLKENPGSVILRTSWVYSAYGRNFVNTMLQLMKDKKVVKVVSDQWGSPTYAADLAAAIFQIILTGKWIPGIFHFCNGGATTWFEFATAIRDISGSNCEVLPILASEFPTKAARPTYSVMNTEKIVREYGLVVNPWKESLGRCLSNRIKKNETL